MILIAAVASLLALPAPAAPPTPPFALPADTARVHVPSAGAIRALPLRPHPRLLVRPGQFEELRAGVRTDPVLRAWYGTLKARADGYLADGDLPRYEIPDGLRLLAMSRRVLERVATLGVVGRIEGDPRYRDRVWEELRTAAAFPDWNPKHFLDVGEMTTAFALGYDWFHPEWTEEQRRLIREAIVTHGLHPAREAYERFGDSGGWPNSEHNWNQVTNGGVAIGALAILESEPALASEILHQGLRRLPLAMRHYGPDGAWSEGPGYWHYATLFNVLVLSALESSLGTDFGLATIPGFDRTGDFPVHVTGPFGPSFNFADVARDRGATYGAELLWLARRFREPAYAAHQLRYGQGLGEGRSSPFNLLWYDGATAAAGRAGAAPLDRYFRGTEVVTMRSAWDPNAIFVGFKAGDNRANHSNLDLGTFVLDALGVRWATELGSDDYNMPGYFDRIGFARDRPRFSYYRMRAEGQNTLVLNPGALADQDPAAAARIERFRSQPMRAHAIADLSAAYAPDARRVRRGIALLEGRRQVLVQDEIRLRRPGEAWWFMHTEAEVELAPDGSTATLTRDGKRLIARVLAPAGARFSVMDARPLPTSPDPSMQNRNAGIRKLAVRLEGVTDARIAVLLAPVPRGEAIPATSPAVRPLSAW